MCASLCVPLPSSSFVPCVLHGLSSVQLVHSEGCRGVFLHFFQILVSTMLWKIVYVTGVSFVPGTPKPGPYSPPSVGRQEHHVELNSAVGQRVGGPICLGGHCGLAEFVCLVAIGGTGMWNDCEGIELASRASLLQKVGRGVCCNYAIGMGVID